MMPGKVVVIGGGVVGFNAAQMAAGLGADVTILDRDPEVLERVGTHFESRAKTRLSNAANLYDAVCEADLVIGAVLIPGAAAPKLVTREMLRDMQKGAVLVDVAIDQGGCFETSKPTTHAEPTYVVDDIVHYCVANNGYLRKLLVIGATSVLRRARIDESSATPWLHDLLERKPARLVTIAVANKTARTAWALMKREEVYRKPSLA